MSEPSAIGLALEAIRAALERLSKLRPSEPIIVLRQECEVCDATVRSWIGAQPSATERERMMRKLLALHIAITSLTRK